jgi:hypothetical protein
MRWRKKIYHGPRIGDLRVRKHFALFPVRIGVFTVWLEFYYQVDKCWHVHGGFAGARWKGEYTSFDLQSSVNYITSTYEPYKYIRSLRLYRDTSSAFGQSPWYQSKNFIE